MTKRNRQQPGDATNRTPVIKNLTRRDRIERQLPAILSLSPSLVLRFNERILGWFQALRPNGTATAVTFLPDDTHTLIVAAQVGDSDAAPLIYGKTGRTARCGAQLGFYPEDIPLLREGTVYFDVERLQLPDGTPCLGVNYATAELSKMVKVPKRKRKPVLEAGALPTAAAGSQHAIVQQLPPEQQATLNQLLATLAQVQEIVNAVREGRIPPV